MSIFLSPSTERNFCILLDKLEAGDRGNSGESREKVKIWVSKDLLAVASTVFKTMFYGDFRESQLSETEPLYLPDKNDEDFLKFLDCLFPYPTQSDVGESNVKAVLRLSDEYQVESLIKKCDQYYDKLIRSQLIGDKAILDYSTVILKYKLNESIKICVPYAAALDVEVLAQYRLQSLKVDGYHRFYAAVYEAKLRRMLHEEHSWKLEHIGLYVCQKCRDRKSKRNPAAPKCLEFHICYAKNSGCICGYEFESLFI